jgi:hypothetical protein
MVVGETVAQQPDGPIPLLLQRRHLCWGCLRAPVTSVG